MKVISKEIQYEIIFHINNNKFKRVFNFDDILNKFNIEWYFLKETNYIKCSRILKKYLEQRYNKDKSMMSNDKIHSETEVEEILSFKDKEYLRYYMNHPYERVIWFTKNTDGQNLIWSNESSIPENRLLYDELEKEYQNTNK